jgi:two-component system NarL family sensor kinase
VAEGGVGGVGGDGVDRDEVRRLRAELESCRQLVAQVMEAEDAARRRIAQLIHDDALQSLLAAHQELIEAAPGRAQVMRAQEVVAGSIERLREALVALHPVTLEQGGFEQALGAVARQVERQGGFEVEVDVDAAALGDQDELLLAIARELLANAARHSGAKVVGVRLRRTEDAVVLEIADDGSGIEPGRPQRALAEGHIGLASVAQRLQAVRGELELLDVPGGGTLARARLPG